MTRIVAGAYGGRRLATPAGRDTRPTSDRVREALFGTLAALTEVEGARVADLYAGSGAVGLEALSRGAEHILLVESDPKAIRAIRENVERLSVAQAVTVRSGRVEQVLAAGPGDARYDVVFADPPYRLADEPLSGMLRLVAEGWLAADAILALERSTRSGPPVGVQGVTFDRFRTYGETTIWYGRAS